MEVLGCAPMECPGMSHYNTFATGQSGLVLCFALAVATGGRLTGNKTDYSLSFTVVPASDASGPSSETLLSSIVGSTFMWMQSPSVQRVPGALRWHQ